MGEEMIIYLCIYPEEILIGTSSLGHRRKTPINVGELYSLIP